MKNGLIEARFLLAPSRFAPWRPRLAGGRQVFVTVNGDLIHDCHGLPVDADFFGTFPTGDGVRGGVMRSWFFVTDGNEVRA